MNNIFFYITIILAGFCILLYCYKRAQDKYVGECLSDIIARLFFQVLDVILSSIIYTLGSIPTKAVIVVLPLTVIGALIINSGYVYILQHTAIRYFNTIINAILLF